MGIPENRCLRQRPSRNQTTKYYFIIKVELTQEESGPMSAWKAFFRDRKISKIITFFP
jgi:hypothetical protein